MKHNSGISGFRWNKEIRKFFDQKDEDDSGEMDLNEVMTMFNIQPPVDTMGPKPPICQWLPCGQPIDKARGWVDVSCNNKSAVTERCMLRIVWYFSQPCPNPRHG